VVKIVVKSPAVDRKLAVHEGFEDGKVRRFMAYFDTCRLTNQVVD
jgi:hypothetical protein